MSVPPIVRKEIKDYSKVMLQNLTENYITPNYNPNTTLHEACYLFEEELGQGTKPNCTIEDYQVQWQTNHPWHNKFIKEQKRKKYKKYKQDRQWPVYTKEKNTYNRLLIYHKTQTLSLKIKDSNKDTKKAVQPSQLTSLTANPSMQCQKAKPMSNWVRNLQHSSLKKSRRYMTYSPELRNFKPSTNVHVPLLRTFFTTLLQWSTQGNTQYEQQTLQTGPHSLRNTQENPTCNTMSHYRNSKPITFHR